MQQSDIKLKENYYLALTDADSIIHSSAAYIQDNFILAKHTESGKAKEFKNITAFREWLKNTPKGRKQKEENFTFETKPRLNASVSKALATIDLKIKAIMKEPWCKDIKIFVGGKGNYRKDLDPLYKSSRPDKPIAFKACYDYVINKYKDKVIICDGEEAEDRVGIEAYADWTNAQGDFDKLTTVVCAIDKDVDMIPSLRYNYQKPKLGVYPIDDRYALSCFHKQMLMGDSTDDIKGLDYHPEALTSVYKINKKGLGESSALGILEGAESSQEELRRVVHAYQLAYGEEWVAKANLAAQMLLIRRIDNQMFDIRDACQELGVDYEGMLNAEG